jgi:hypothetical protein
MPPKTLENRKETTMQIMVMPPIKLFEQASAVNQQNSNPNAHGRKKNSCGA